MDELVEVAPLITRPEIKSNVTGITDKFVTDQEALIASGEKQLTGKNIPPVNIIEPLEFDNIILDSLAAASDSRRS